MVKAVVKMQKLEEETFEKYQEERRQHKLLKADLKEANEYCVQRKK